MRLKSEDEILKPEVRKAIVEEIESTENQRRKAEAFRRWQVYKDKTSTFVIEMLLEQFDEATVREMSYSITNISMVRKIINKLARVYSNGVQRSVSDNEQATEQMEQLESVLQFNKKMKTLNRMLKLQRNAISYVKPCPFIDIDGEEKMRIRISPMNPYLYDVVEEFYDRTQPLVYILSDYQPGGLLHTSLDPAKVRTQSGHLRSGFNSFVTPSQGTGGLFGNRQDETIADKKEDENAAPESERPYIWWTDKYHFTTRGPNIVDKNGVPVNLDTEEGLAMILNPIEEKPIVNFSIDQDNSFWAEGGEDVVDAGITVNSMLSQVNHVGVVQGYGQFFMSGKNLPKNQILGVNRGILLEYEPEDGDPKPEAGFLSANPPLRELMENTLSLVALTLTTNDLSVTNVSANLSDAGQFPSGIAMLIDKAESLEDVSDQASEFAEGEHDIWRIYSKWQQHFSEEGVLDPELEEFSLPEDMDLEIQFNKPEAIATETEKLDNLKKRKELGLNTEAEILQKDQPELTLEQAEEKLKKIAEEKQARMAAFAPVTNGEDGENEDDLENPNPFEPNEDDEDEGAQN